MVTWPLKRKKKKKTKDIVISLTYSLLGGYVLVDRLNFEPLYKRTYDIMILHKKKKKKTKKQNYECNYKSKYNYSSKILFPKYIFLQGYKIDF